jgi:hypothetical protein
MSKNIAAMTLVSFSIALLPGATAFAGSSVSAPSKYAHATDAGTPVRHRQPVQVTQSGVTDFTSSSAKSSVPKR